MPENPVQYLNRITLTMPDDLYAAVTEGARAEGTSVEAFIVEQVRAELGLSPSTRLSIQTLRQKLVEEMTLYAKDGLNAHGFLLQSEDRSIFAAVDIGKIKGERFVNTGLLVRITGDYIVVERDMNDKPLVDSLLQAGTPREQIILAYAGEPVPETAI